MTEPPLDPAEVLATLNEHGVAFVLIGGLAAAVHGSPFVTFDVDVTPEQSSDNLERLSAALSALDARIRTQGEPDGLPFAHSGSSLGAARVWNLITRAGDLDISFVPNGTDGFADLIRDASPLPVDGVVVPVASLADVIRSKQAANRPKDQRVLPTLREINARRHEN